MMTKSKLKELRDEAETVVAKAQAIAAKTQLEGREFTTDERREFDNSMAKSRSLLEQIKEGRRDLEVFDAAKSLASEIGSPEGEGGQAKGRGYLALGRKAVAGTVSGIAEKMTYDQAGGTKALLPSGAVVSTVPMLAESPIALGRRVLSLLDAVPAITRAAHYSYLRQNGRTNNAAPVAIGATKPTTVLGLENIEAALEVVAHLSEPVHSYWLTDNTNLEQFIAAELLYGLQVALENQFLNGSGASPQLDGVLGASGIQVQAFATNLLTTTRQAITKAETAGHEPGLFVLAPGDWEALELARTDTAGQLELGGPVDRAARKVWGVPVAVSTALPAKTGALLDLSSVGISTDANGIEVKWSENVADDFTKNQTRARVEGRFQADVFQPLGVVKIATATA
ncbi:phage major capsid protein, HK97 family [Rhodococcus sp. MTM3W5.2]|uniref:phage major capsid protein n=1 Tax=Rhodococcus sp. MTM3W5.2 TaxID=1805827 RepID=UPI0009791CAE|nr:phage major capsid protein [Rhodococcus sp. MTM3W5.2]AQA26082.1 phage major capsid protein, HK97 family [Rhodococcus sp. MTM3W5.2]